MSMYFVYFLKKAPQKIDIESLHEKLRHCILYILIYININKEILRLQVNFIENRFISKNKVYLLTKGGRYVLANIKIYNSVKIMQILLYRALLYTSYFWLV